MIPDEGIFWYHESILVLNNMLGRWAPYHPAKDELLGTPLTKKLKSADPLGPDDMAISAHEHPEIF